MRPVVFIVLSLLSVWFGPAQRTAPSEVRVVPVQELTLDPNASVWSSVALHTAKLVPQDLVTPKLLEPSTQEIQAGGISDGTNIAIRLEWLDKTLDDRPRPGAFPDACAIQLPTTIAPVTPVIAMGQPSLPVDMTFWRADWQAIVDGRADSINVLYPNASIDHYNANAKPLEKNIAAQTEFSMRESPARALGNRRAGPREQPVEDLVGLGPMDLRPATNSFSKGRGVRTSSGWAVVLSRPIPKGFSRSNPTNIAFAVWEGSHAEVGARKMRTAWVRLIMEDLVR